MIAAVHSIKILQAPTCEAWLKQALANLDIILLDHSHCERKAAGVALNLMFRYQSHGRLIRQLTAIAQEELEHFEQVNQWLERRSIAHKPLVAAPYGTGLKSHVRRHEPVRLLDSLLVAALIEARSHERLGLLAAHCSDVDLRGFYRQLMISEARHYGAYWLLANEYFERSQVDDRLTELAQVEHTLLSSLHPEPRMHS